MFHLLKNQQETAWINPYFLPFAMTDAMSQLVVSDADIEDARKRLARFAPFICKCFPETKATGGRLVPEKVWEEYLAKADL